MDMAYSVLRDATLGKSTSERFSRYSKRALKHCIIKPYLPIFDFGVGSVARYTVQQSVIALAPTYAMCDLGDTQRHQEWLYHTGGEAET